MGPIRLVSWPAWCASSGAVSPQTQAHRACQLNCKHSRFRGRTCGHNASFLMCFRQQLIQLFTFVWGKNYLSPESVRDSPTARISCALIGQNWFAPGAHPLFSHVTPFVINIGQFDQAGNVRLATGWEAPELSKRDDTLTNWGLTLEVRGTTGFTHVLGDGIGATEHEWACWCFGATEHLCPYRMKCGLGGSVAQNTTAISLVVSFSLIFSPLVNHVVLVWRMNANRLIWPY